MENLEITYCDICESEIIEVEECFTNDIDNESILCKSCYEAE